MIKSSVSTSSENTNFNPKNYNKVPFLYRATDGTGKVIVLVTSATYLPYARTSPNKRVYTVIYSENGSSVGYNVDYAFGKNCELLTESVTLSNDLLSNDNS